MSDPDEEDDMSDDKDSLSRSGVGDGDVDVDVDTREEEEEEDSDDFFDAGEGRRSIFARSIREQPERWWDRGQSGWAYDTKRDGGADNQPDLT